MPRPRTERRLPRPGVARLASESDPGLAAVVHGSRPQCSRRPTGRKRTRSQARPPSRPGSRPTELRWVALRSGHSQGRGPHHRAPRPTWYRPVRYPPARHRSARCRWAGAHWNRRRSAWSTATARPEPSSSRPSWPDARHHGLPFGGSTASPRGVRGYARESCRAGNGQRPRHDAGSSSTCSEPRPRPCDRRPCTRSRRAHRR